MVREEIREALTGDGELDAYPHDLQEDEHKNVLGNSFKTSVEKFFKIKERGSTIGTEVKAGLITFLTMSYILLINPQVLEEAGLDKNRTAIATAMSACLATLVAGVCGNLPFGISPGMGLNTMLAITQVKLGGFSPELVFAWVLIANIALAILAACRLLNFLMALVPSEIKQGTIVGIGLLLAFIALQNANIIVANEDTCVSLGPIFENWRAWLVMSELIVIATLLFHGIQFGLFVGIFAGTITCWFIEHSWPTSVASIPDILSCFENVDFAHLKWTHIAHIVPYILVLIFDIGGIMFGLGNMAGLVKGRHLEGGVWGYIGAAAGGILGAFMGTGPSIIFAENAAGIKGGGRTGLTAVVIAFLFGISVFFLPVVTVIPQDATGAVLILTGASMMAESSSINWNSIRVALPAFLTIVVQPLTFDIATGIYFGFAASVILWMTSGVAYHDLREILYKKKDENGHISYPYALPGPGLHQPTADVSN